MRDTNDFVDPFNIKKLTKICRHAFEAKSVQIRRIVSAAVPQQVRDYDTIAVIGEVCDLMVPPVRSFRKSMQK